MKIVRIMGALILVLALVAGLILVRQNQETRKGAFFAKAEMSMWPDTKEIGVGEEVTAKIKLNAGIEKVSGVDLKINYESKVAEVVSVEINKMALGTVSKENFGNGVIELVAFSTKNSDELASGVFDVATIKIKGKSNGVAKFTMANDYEIVGWNESGDDKRIEVDFRGASYVVGDGGGEEAGEVNFEVTPVSREIKMGEKIKVEAWLKSGDVPISAVNLKIKFDNLKLEASNLVKSEVFDSAPVLTVDNATGVMSMSLLSMKPTNSLPKGDLKLASFEIKGKGTGKGKISLMPTYEIVTDGGEKVAVARIDEGNYDVVDGVALTPTPRHFSLVDTGVSPASQVIKAGEKGKLKLWLKSGTTKISGVKMELFFDKEKLEVEKVMVTEGFAMLASKINNDIGKVEISMASLKPSNQLASGEIDLVEMDIRALKSGEVDFFVGDEYEIVGYNPGGGNNLVGIAVRERAVVKIEAVETDESVLNFRMAFGRLAGDANCVTNWPVQVTLMANGQSKVYSGIVVERDLGVTDRVVFKGSVPLAGFEERGNVAVFIKAVKHLQMKYGENNQNKLYTRPGGEITLEKGVMYDFSGYPLLAGDVTGKDGKQDGWINGLDFSLVKQKSLTHETVEKGGYLLEDLDGNCQVNSNDVTVLKISLGEKQEILY